MLVQQYGPSAFSAPPGRKNYIAIVALLPLLLLGAFWRHEFLNVYTAALSFLAGLGLCRLIPITHLFTAERHKRNYEREKLALTRRIAEPSCGEIECRKLKRKLIRLDDQHHLVINPEETFRRLRQLESAQFFIASWIVKLKLPFRD